MNLFTPGSMLTIFIASALGFYVAPHLALVSRTGALAMKLAAGVLALGIALDFTAPFLLNQLFYRLNLNGEPYQVIHPLIHGGFWALLAWSVLAVIQGAQPKGIQ